MTPQPILIYGVCGSGKSTLAARIAKVSGIRFHSVDDMTFEADWQPVPLEVQCERIATIVAGDSWILDSAYAKWLPIVLDRADLIVGLDYPGPLVFGRLLRRSVMRSLDGRPICNGNRESFRLLLSRESILLWFFKSYRRKRMRLRAWEANGSCPVLRLRHPREVERLLAAWHTD